MTPLKNATIAFFLCLSAAGTAIAGPDAPLDEPSSTYQAIPSVAIDAAAVENLRPEASGDVEIIDRREGWNQQTVLAQVAMANAEPQLWLISMERNCSRSQWQPTTAVDLSSLATWFKQLV